MVWKHLSQPEGFRPNLGLCSHSLQSPLHPPPVSINSNFLASIVICLAEPAAAIRIIPNRIYLLLQNITKPLAVFCSKLHLLCTVLWRCVMGTGYIFGLPSVQQLELGLSILVQTLHLKSSNRGTSWLEFFSLVLEFDGWFGRVCTSATKRGLSHGVASILFN